MRILAFTADITVLVKLIDDMVAIRHEAHDRVVNMLTAQVTKDGREYDGCHYTKSIVNVHNGREWTEPWASHADRKKGQ